MRTSALDSHATTMASASTSMSSNARMNHQPLGQTTSQTTAIGCSRSPPELST
jgi:hypothetical protein